MTAAALPHTDRRLFALGLRLLSVACFSTMSMMVKLASESGLRLPEIMFWRQAAAIPLIVAWVWLGAGVGSLRTTRFDAHAKRSLLGTTGMFFTFGSVILLPLAEAATISFTVPIFATILSALVLKERVGVHRWSAVVIGFLGVLIVVRPGGADFPLVGALVGLTAAMAISLVSLQIRDLGRTEPASTTAFWFSFNSAVLLGLLHWLPVPGAIGAALDWGPGGHSLHQWLLLAGAGLAGGAGQTAMTGSLKYAPVSVVVAMDYSALLWSTLFGWLIWATLPGPWTWVGAPVIVASGLYIAWREHRLHIERVKEIAA